MVSLAYQTTGREKLLSHVTWKRRFFNASSKEDLIEYQFFVENDRWRTSCPFELEWPHLNIDNMIKAKIVQDHLDKLIKNAK